MRYSLVIFLCLIICSCTIQEQKEKAKIDIYFDLEGTLDQMIIDLVDQKARLEKRSLVKDQEGDSIIGPLSADDWKAQLRIFYEADINKLGLEKTYQIESLEAFDGIKKTTYTALNKSPYVKTIECSYRDGKLFIVRVLTADKNFVYQIENELTLYFNHFKKKLALDHFTIDSQEKMMFKESLEMKIEGTVLLP